MDWSELKKDEDWFILELLEIQVDALARLKRYGKEAGVRKVIYETWKRWNGEMDTKTLDARKYQARAPFNNKNSLASNKRIQFVLKDCYTLLKRDLSYEVIEQLWSAGWISDEEWNEINPLVQVERNEKFIDELMTK